MKLLAFLMQTGGHIAGWRHPTATSGALTKIDYFRHLAQTAERGLFDAVFLADSVGFPPARTADIFACTESPKLDPALLLSAIAATTERIGLIATASTTYNQPYDLARRFATLDHISGGRAGWNIVTSTMENEAHNYGRDSHMEHEARYERAEEFLVVAKKLWDSWEDGAVTADKSTGRYADPSRIHTLRHVGKHFCVEGPLNVPRSPQAYPVLVQAGASTTGKRFAAQCAEVIFTSHPSKQSAVAFRAEMHALLAEYGRTPDSLKILPAITPVIGKIRAEAEALQSELDALIPPELAISKLESLLNHFDLSGYPSDGPLPPIPKTENSTQDRVVELAARENLTIAQLAHRVASRRTSTSAIGTAEDVADLLAEWYIDGAGDGFVISPPSFPTGLVDFVDSVVPILQSRGLFRTHYEGRTLRENLGLERPVNHFVVNASEAVASSIW